MFEKELKIVWKAKIEITLLFIENKQKQQFLKIEKSKNLTSLILKFKNLKKKKQKKKTNKVFREFLKSKSFIEKQLLLKLFIKKLLSLNIKLFFAIILKFKTTITKITKFFLQIVIKFIFVDWNNNAKVCEYVKININFQYKINYCLIILIKILQIVDLIIFEKFQNVNYEILFLKSILCFIYWKKLTYLLKIFRLSNKNVKIKIIAY